MTREELEAAIMARAEEMENLGRNGPSRAGSLLLYLGARMWMDSILSKRPLLRGAACFLF